MRQAGDTFPREQPLVRRRREKPEEGRPEQHARHHLADDLRLAEPAAEQPHHRHATRMTASCRNILSTSS